MGIVKRAADLAFTFRFLRMLVMDWKNWDAYKLGIIDDSGKRVRSVQLDSDEKKSAYTPFIRLAANIKRLVGQNAFTSLASALYLMKESYDLTDKQVEKILAESNVEIFDLLVEESKWFMLKDQQLAPGVYRLRSEKVLNRTMDDVVFAGDQVRVSNESFPVGQVLGLNIYEATHVRTKQPVYITVGEITR